MYSYIAILFFLILIFKALFQASQNSIVKITHTKKKLEKQI